MAALPIYLDSTHRVKAAATVVVSWKQNWQDDWQEAINVQVESLDRGCAPHIDRCVMRQRYGYIADNADSSYRIVFPVQPSIIKSFVRVVITPDLLTVANATARLLLQGLDVGAVVYESGTATVYRFNGPLGTEATAGNWAEHEIDRTETWYGVITNLRRDAMGGDVLGESGDLIIEALGMEVLLTRKQITTSVIEDVAETSTITIGRGLPFNAHRGDRDRGTYQTANKAADYGPDGVSVFAKTLTQAENWTATEIVEYLLMYHPPCNVSGPEFQMDYSQAALDAFYPIDVETDGRTVYDVLNAVIDRNRGILWWVEPYWADEALIFLLRVESSEVADVTLPSGVTIPRNQHYRSLAIDSVGDMLAYRENYDGLRRYAQVVVEGGRQGAVFTLAVEDGTLEADWDTTEEGRYKTAAATMPTYNILDRSHQATVNDNARMSDAFRHVYTRFRVPSDWDGKAGNGTGGAKYHVFPELEAEGSAPAVQTGNAFWHAGLRFQNNIPLKAQWDFSDTGYSPINRNKAGTVAEYRRPFAVVSIPNASGGDEWFMADMAGVSTVADELRGKANQRLSCSLRMHEEQPGVTLTPSGPSHALAGSDTAWNGSDATRSVSHLATPPTDYEKAKFTVYALADNRVTVQYPETATTTSNQASVHVIRLGDRARVDYVVPGTIVDVANGELDRTALPMFARDDRATMIDLARQAWLWYGTTRIAVDLSVANVTNQIRLGDLIGEVTYGYRFMTTTNGTIIMFGSKPWARVGSTDRVVNSAVTRVHWDFLRQSTNVVTDYAQLDFQAEAVGAA